MFSSGFVTRLVNHLDSDDVARALQDYLSRWSSSEVFDALDVVETVLGSEKLPEDVVELLFEEFSEDSPIVMSYFASSPSLKSEKIIREIVDVFLKIDDDVYNGIEYDWAKYYLSEAFSKNQYLPADVEELLKKESEKTLREMFNYVQGSSTSDTFAYEVAISLLGNRFSPDDIKREITTWLE